MGSIILSDTSNSARFWGGWTLVAVTTINCISSLLLLVLIRYMIKEGRLKMNLYIWMVGLMTLSTLLWDATFYFELYMHERAQGGLYQGLCGLFGTSAALWNFNIVGTVYMASTAGHKDKHWTNMNNGVYLKRFIIINSVLSIAACAYMSASGDLNSWEFYDIERFTIASFSMLILIVLMHKLYQTTTPETRWTSPLWHLLRKLALYPISNIFSRLATIPYDWVYGIPLYKFPRSAGATQIFVLFAFVILTPCCGFLDLLIFCRMQNGAESLKDMLWTHPTAEEIEAKMAKEKEIRASRASRASRATRDYLSSDRRSSDVHGFDDAAWGREKFSTMSCLDEEELCAQMMQGDMEAEAEEGETKDIKEQLPVDQPAIEMASTEIKTSQSNPVLEGIRQDNSR